MKKELETPFHGAVGESAAFRHVLEVASKMAAYDVPVLIEGEAGTGKEWLARAIHFASPRAKRDFIVVDCAGFSDLFFESELFGYVRGSFAGAIHDKKGLLELADGGTLFFDRVGTLKPALQSKLARLLKDGTFYKIGGVGQIRVNVRFIASTDIDLKTLVSKHKFREDLYYQLNVMRIIIPPLRERREDILLLAEWFLSETAKKEGVERKELTKEAKTILESYAWPGNVGELEKEIEKSAILAAGSNKIGVQHLNPYLVRGRKEGIDSKDFQPSSNSLRDQKRKMIATLEKQAIREALKKTAGNKTKASGLLGISRQELIRKVSHLKIKG